MRTYRESIGDAGLCQHRANWPIRERRATSRSLETPPSSQRPRRDSNAQPTDSKSGALSVELRGPSSRLYLAKRAASSLRHANRPQSPRVLVSPTTREFSITFCAWREGAGRHQPQLPTPCRSCCACNDKRPPPHPPPPLRLQARLVSQGSLAKRGVRSCGRWGREGLRAMAEIRRVFQRPHGVDIAIAGHVRSFASAFSSSWEHAMMIRGAGQEHCAGAGPASAGPDRG